MQIISILHAAKLSSSVSFRVRLEGPMTWGLSAFLSPARGTSSWNSHKIGHKFERLQKRDICSGIRSMSCTAAEQPHTSKRTPPPRPSIIPPPVLPSKDDDIWSNCALLVDKPADWTSSDVVCKLRWRLNVKKIGHAGTLDPQATGLLVVCIGKGTKNSEALTSEDKVYTGVMRLGEATASYDVETEVSESGPWEHLTDADLQAAATKNFTGKILQASM
jgi:TruB family pseudouridylate synthase (N terminal domain)